MKKNKIVLSLSILVLSLFFGMDITQAVYYNGGANDMGSGSSSGSCNFSSNAREICPWSNSSYVTVKISIWFIKDGKFVANKGSVYWTTNSYYTSGNYAIANFKMAPYKKGSTKERVISAGDSWETTNKNIIDYFGLKKEAYRKDPSPEMEKFFEEVMGSEWKEKFDGEGQIGDSKIISQEQNKTKPATYGYRIIIEPVLNYKVNNYGKETLELLTVKEVAKKVASGYTNKCTIGGPGICTFAFGGYTNGDSGYAAALTVDFKDVGITKGTTNEFISTNANASTSCRVLKESEKAAFYKEVAKDTNGCGYNIIDITNYTENNSCYNKTVIGGSLKCTETDQNNIGNFTEKYTEYICKNEEYKTNTNSEYGKLIKKLDNCSIYCVESATASFPGHISETLLLENISKKGNYFTWPSRIGTSGMKMFMKTKLTCRIKEINGKKCTNENVDLLKDAVKSEVDKINMSASLKAGTNKKIDDKLTGYNNNYYYENWNNVKVQNDGWSNTISIEKETYFKIPNNKNRLYNKESGNVFDGTSSVSKSVFDRQEGVISLLAEQDTNKIYDLEIKNVELGTGNQFGTLISNYVCKYKVANSPCTCPEGTLMAGTSLHDRLVEGKTCSELQETLCNICQCPPSSSNEYDEILIGDDATTKACEDLQKKQCYNNYCTFNGKTINLTNCINEQMTKEDLKLTKEEATTYCEQKLCPECIDSYGIRHDLTECLASGKPYALCEYKYCPRNVCIGKDCYECSKDCKWTLKEKTKTTLAYKKSCSDGNNCGYVKMSCPAGNENMLNADSCIQEKLLSKLKGKTVAIGLTEGIINSSDVRNAFAACEEEVCPYSGGKIIYRQIDLNDPFPGKNHIGTNTNSKFTNNNQNIKSRKPGENWNSEIVITTKILNARGVKGYELYNKDPLYIIVLTPDAIKKIRNYNEKNEYDDFNLTCTNTNKTSHCISDFLHKGIDNLNSRDFIKTSYGNKNSVSACYNMDYSENSFNKCYNEDN